MLDAVPVELGRSAARAVDGHCWDSTKRVPDRALVKRRSFDFEAEVVPWLVPASLAPPELPEACGEDPDRVVLRGAPNEVYGVRIADWVTLEIRPSRALRKQFPFNELGEVITQADLPRIIDEVRKQNLADFGPNAEGPD
jgi:hypothetical protein